MNGAKDWISRTLEDVPRGLIEVIQRTGLHHEHHPLDEANESSLGKTDHLLERQLKPSLSCDARLAPTSAPPLSGILALASCRQELLHN